jgi:general stress protein YciG
MSFDMVTSCRVISFSRVGMARAASETPRRQRMANEQRGGSGNFANDPKRASEAGKKGRQQQQSGGSRVSKEA